MNGNGETPGIDPNSAAAAVGSTLPGIRRIGTLVVAGGSAYLRPEGDQVFHPVRRLGSTGFRASGAHHDSLRSGLSGGSARVQEAPKQERFHETLVFDGLNPVEIPGANGGTE